MKTEYNYRFRPGYYSEKWLIEIINGEGFDLRVFLDAIKDLSPKVLKPTNDELLLFLGTDHQTVTIETIAGKLTIDIDIWGFVFISADNNKCVNTIEEKLNGHCGFAKREVDIEKYTVSGILKSQLKNLLEHLHLSENSACATISVLELKTFINDTIGKVENNEVVEIDKLKILIAPTGSLQEISIDNGWGKEFLKISEKIEKAIDRKWGTPPHRITNGNCSPPVRRLSCLEH